MNKCQSTTTCIKRHSGLKSATNRFYRWPMESKVTPVVLVLVFLIGCTKDPRGAVNIADYDGHSWTSSAEDGVPGIDSGSVTAVTLRTNHEDEISLVVWSDLSYGRAGQCEKAGDVGIGWGVRGSHFHGAHSDESGHKFQYVATTTDGTDGTFTINEQRYDLNDGQVFLVSNQSAFPIVLQMKINPFDCPKEDDFYKQFAKSHPALQTFFSTKNNQQVQDGELSNR